MRAQEKKVDDCITYFTEIIEIQKLREMLQLGSSEMIRRYNTGNLTKEELDTTLAVWYATENELRQKVAKIYDVAYAAKCFEDLSRKEEK